MSCWSAPAGCSEPSSKTFCDSSTLSLAVTFCKYQKSYKHHDWNDTMHAHCAGCISTNIRPHQLSWSDQEMGMHDYMNSTIWFQNLSRLANLFLGLQFSLLLHTHTYIYNPLSALSCKEIPIVIMTFQCIHVISDYTTHCLTCVVVSSSPLQLTMPCLCSCLSASLHVHVSGTLKLATFISHKTPSICHHTVVSLGYEANLCRS